jgi:hypothetical protein
VIKDLSPLTAPIVPNLMLKFDPPAIECMLHCGMQSDCQLASGVPGCPQALLSYRVDGQGRTCRLALQPANPHLALRVIEWNVQRVRQSTIGITNTSPFTQNKVMPIANVLSLRALLSGHIILIRGRASPFSAPPCFTGVTCCVNVDFEFLADGS